MYDLVIVGGGAAGLTAALYASRSGLDCIVLDPFGGSGSTLIACEQTDRVCDTIELDEKYCDVIVKRYYQNFPDQPIFRNGERIDPEIFLKNPDNS